LATVFCVLRHGAYFHVSSVRQGAKRAETRSKPIPSASRILVVEDDAPLRFVICEVLREGDLEVVEANSADAALIYLETNDRVDLVFTDVTMPGSMDGFELARAVTEQFPTVKLIVTSGKPPPSGLHPIPFIPKPYVVYDVLDVIRAAL